MNPVAAPFVLWAEDQDFEEILMRRAIKEAGLNWSFIRVKDGSQAVAYLEGSPPFENRGVYPLPSLVLIDINMPRTDGFEFLDWFKGQPQFKALPIIVFSSSTLEKDVNRALELGAAAYRVKSSEQGALIALAQEIYNRCLEVTEKTSHQQLV
jgi:CheY-like chemotaxis protein